MEGKGRGGQESCSFIKTTGMKGHVQDYQCIKRGGVYKPKGTGKRHLKSQGTCKIQHNCTVTLKARTTEDGKITVDLCLTHYGHQKDLQHTGLPKQKKEEMAALL